jgi:hypothetical protein
MGSDAIRIDYKKIHSSTETEDADRLRSEMSSMQMPYALMPEHRSASTRRDRTDAIMNSYLVGAHLYSTYFLAVELAKAVLATDV